MNKKLLFKMSKMFYYFFQQNEKNKKIVFIMGCQRSGTSLLRNIFENDYRSKTFQDKSILTDVDKIHHIRLNPFDIVHSQLQKVKSSLIILKPLVESQNSLKLLKYFTNSRIIWIYRDFRSVANSNLKMFGVDNGINDLKPIVEAEKNNWRSENVSIETREKIKSLYSVNMDPYDAASLFWYARNQLFFDQQLEKNSNVALLDYNYLVSNPTVAMKKIYSFINIKYPGNRIIKSVHKNSQNKGKNIEISSEVENLCNELQAKLDGIFYK